MSGWGWVLCDAKGRVRIHLNGLGPAHSLAVGQDDERIAGVESREMGEAEGTCSDAVIGHTLIHYAARYKANCKDENGVTHEDEACVGFEVCGDRAHYVQSDGLHERNDPRELNASEENGLMDQLGACCSNVGAAEEADDAKGSGDGHSEEGVDDYDV